MVVLHQLYRKAKRDIMDSLQRVRKLMNKKHQISVLY